MDKLYIRDLKTRCIVGINDDERINKQDVIINVVIHGDLSVPCHSDRIEDTIDYKGIKKRIIAMVEDSSFGLIERLAEEVASICLSDSRVCRADVTIDKPGALRYARSVAVEISRSRP
jgi:FolB domain-containing protein